MENTYLTALHGMETLLDPMEDIMSSFNRQKYAASFQRFYAMYLPTFQALEEGYNNAIDKEQYLFNMAEAVVQNAVKRMEGVTRKSKRNAVTMDMNMCMVVFTIPSLKHFSGNVSDPFIEELLRQWKETFPDTNLQATTQEEIAEGFRHKWCYITTAVCQTFQKPDDCYELTVFRDYRDHYLLESENGEELIRKYYDVAPTIVKHINKSEHADTIYQNIWDQYLQPCLHMIENHQLEECKELYQNMVDDLAEEYFYTN